MTHNKENESILLTSVRIVAAMILIVVGALLILTLVGAVIGVPMLIIGILLLARFHV